uniref:Alcohol dehydrogenase, C-terminal n=1 Tax=Tanacetum cinerariifolium TaxID=118510 RepID=A0A6L2LCP0_TANCI|nr:alcohol dehydrogenase, C-terminal [Tanacetum cinerariifolium]
MPHYRCWILELLEKRVRGCFYGWLILSSHPIINKWSLWNPLTSKIIGLLTLILEDGQYESIRHCCLSAYPDDPTLILLLTRTNKSTFVFCRLDKKKKKFRWTEMSYARQLKKLTHDGELIHIPTSCNGKAYALSTDAGITKFVIHADIVVRDKEVSIKLMLLSECPFPWGLGGKGTMHYLKRSTTELFYIRIYIDEQTMRTEKAPVHLNIFKSDMTCIDWEKMECLKEGDITDYDFDVSAF